MLPNRIVKLHFKVLPSRIDVEQPPRAAFWGRLRNSLSQSREKLKPDFSVVPPSDDECEEALYQSFGWHLERHFNDPRPEKTPLDPESGTYVDMRRPRSVEPYADIKSWAGARFSVASIQYRSLTLGVLVAGTKGFLEMVDRYPDVFQELLLGFAPQALGESLGAPVGMFLHTTVETTQPLKSGSSEVAVTLIRQLRPFIPLFVAVAILFVLAYNELIDLRQERAVVATREERLIDRQQKLLEVEQARVASVEAHPARKCTSTCDEARTDKADTEPATH